MGSNKFYHEERPTFWQAVSPFWIDIYEVRTSDFSLFVSSTGHVTVAEKPPPADLYKDAPKELLHPGSLVFVRPRHEVTSFDDHSQWWKWVLGADWRRPRGPDGPSALDTPSFPVVQVAHPDADAYCKWLGKRLPTESEWEFAARGGLEGADFTWPVDVSQHGDGVLLANTWQGRFPVENMRLDGFSGAAPVGSFQPNGYGLYDMAGNVWEWTSDWFTPSHADRPGAVAEGPAGEPEQEGDGGAPGSCGCSGSKEKTLNGRVDDSTAEEKSKDPNLSVPLGRRVLKGGSFLCAPNYCLRYRPAARIGMTWDSATSHVGFRCAKDV